MSYEVEKYVKAKREDYDNTRVEFDAEVFRQDRCASDLGKAVAESFNEEKNPSGVESESPANRAGMASDATLYERLTAAGCEVSNHYSDLYARYTPEAAAIIDEWRKDHNLTNGWGMCSFFTNQVEGGRWIDIPLAFDPYWKEVLNA